MEHLNNLYIQKLDSIADQIQNSDSLAAYLEEEDDVTYKELVDAFEPLLAELYQEVAIKEPLQLISLELAMMDSKFEGLFMPKLLGFSILRGEVDDNIKYARAQHHIKEVLFAICNNSNFDQIKNRIGQAIQICFGLSSDIWVTNFIDSIPSKKVKTYLVGQKLEKFRERKDRELSYRLFSRQYTNYHFFTSEFPKDNPELSMQYQTLVRFLKERIRINDYHTSFSAKLISSLDNDTMFTSTEHTSLLGLLINYFDLGANDQKKMGSIIDKAYAMSPEKFEHEYFTWLETILASTMDFDVTNEVKAGLYFKDKKFGNLTKYYQLVQSISSKGVAHEDTLESVRLFYSQYEGLSMINECLRLNIYRYFKSFLAGLSHLDYLDYFEINRFIQVYIDGFNNEHFNQKIKEISEAYTSMCLKKFVDKRGKEYQEIKRFVATHFVEMGFLKEKEVAELFKTKRKKKA